MSEVNCSESIKTKVCKQCGKNLPLTDFSKRKDSKDGYRNQCKECKKEYLRQYNKENKKKVAEYHTQYRNENKEYFKKYMQEYYKNNQKYILEKQKQYYKENKYHILEYYKKYLRRNKDYVLKYQSLYRKENRDKILKYGRQYRDENKEYLIEKHKQWVKDNPEKIRAIQQRRRSLKKNLLATLTVEQWMYIKDIFNHKCAYCGQELPLQQEHFIPVSKGGEYTIKNIIPACKHCNCSKNDSDFLEWYPRQDCYDKNRGDFILNFLGYYENMEDKRQII